MRSLPGHPQTPDARSTHMRTPFLLVAAISIISLAACDRTGGVRTSQSAGGPGNAPESERTPSPTPPDGR